MIGEDPKAARLGQKSQAVATFMVMVMVIFLAQLWLITIALEAYLAADGRVAVPTFLASGFCFLLNLWLLKYLYDVDKSARHGD
jgi:hypothetical protein